MLFASGSIVVVSVKEPICFITVRKNFGPIPGIGWLLSTTQGNYIIASGNNTDKQSGLLEKVVFILDPPTIANALNKILK